MRPGRLSPAQREVLQAMAGGWTLKSHRDVDGHKAYQLHPLHGAARTVPWDVVEALQGAGLIDSNKKFPAATYWLTQAGRAHLRPEPPDA